MAVDNIIILAGIMLLFLTLVVKNYSKLLGNIGMILLSAFIMYYGANEATTSDSNIIVGIGSIMLVISITITLIDFLKGSGRSAYRIRRR